MTHRILSNIKELISSFQKGGITIIDTQKLNTQIGVNVFRVSSEINEKPYSFIYKEFEPNRIPNEDFLAYKIRTEMLNYSFLMNIRKDFSRFPELYAYDLKTHALLLEDLGSEPFQFDSQYLNCLLDSLALMQVHTKGKKKE